MNTVKVLIFLLFPPGSGIVHIPAEARNIGREKYKPAKISAIENRQTIKTGRHVALRNMGTQPITGVLYRFNSLMSQYENMTHDTYRND